MKRKADDYGWADWCRVSAVLGAESGSMVAVETTALCALSMREKAATWWTEIGWLPLAGWPSGSLAGSPVQLVQVSYILQHQGSGPRPTREAISNAGGRRRLSTGRD